MEKIYSYSILLPQITFLILDAILLINCWKQKADGRPERAFLFFMISTFLLQLCSVISYACDLKLFSMARWLQYIVNICGVIFLSTCCYTWVQYLIHSEAYIEVLRKPLYQGLLLVPLAVVFVGCVTSPWTHWAFSVNEQGAFVTGTSMMMQLMPYAYWILSIVVTVYAVVKGRNRGAAIRRIVLFLIPAGLGGIINIFFFRGGYTQIGFSLGAVMLYLDLYIKEINENKRLRSIDALNRELIKANEALVAARDEADAASRAKTKFLFNMSHDIRTPMNAILGYTDIGLSHCDDEEKVRTYLNKIKHAGVHLLDLINDILEMSRIESGRLELIAAPVDIRKAVNAVTEMSRALALGKEIELDLHMGDITSPYIYADELHMNEVFINLLSNAVKYTGRGGRVTYSVVQEGEAKEGHAAFRFTVADNGIGMSEEFQQHIFDTFTRENDAAVFKEEGTGLGLSIVKNIVDAAGGSISVESAKNEGSTFTVCLSFPVMTQEEIDGFCGKSGGDVSEDEEAGTSHGGKSLWGKRILYAEDNEINREICTEILTDAGVIVDIAENGAVAVQKVRHNPAGFYDAILMDIRMPVMDGYEAAGAIRKLPQGEHVPIIALSANAFAEDVQNSLDAGMNDHIAKPIDIGRLLKTLKAFSGEQKTGA